MPINIKDTGALAEKFARRVQAAQPDYRAGVANPRRPQNESARSAADNWLAAVTAAGTARFTKGLNRAGEEKWARKASSVGADRYPSGAAAARTDWQNGVAPILDALRTLTLPPRGLRRSPQNIARISAVIDQVVKAADARG